jgi:hypothetical protein
MPSARVDSGVAAEGIPYSEYLAAYPDDPMAARVRAIVAARREAMTWRRTRLVDTPAYWSYLRRAIRRDRTRPMRTVA